MAARAHWRRLARHVAAVGVPTWFAAAMVCIGIHEEGGSNSVAGYYGFVYPPSGYISPGPTVASEYGDAWLGVPRPAQLEVAYALYEAYGFQPWSTRGDCGL